MVSALPCKYHTIERLEATLGRTVPFHFFEWFLNMEAGWPVRWYSKEALEDMLWYWLGGL